MASNKRGSCDPSVSKMLCLHVPSLLPPSFLPMDLASPVQAAAVAGIGLLYQGSSHRLMTEFLLSEMGRQPAKDQNSNDRESFALVGLIFCDWLHSGCSSFFWVMPILIYSPARSFLFIGVWSCTWNGELEKGHINCERT